MNEEAEVGGLDNVLGFDPSPELLSKPGSHEGQKPSDVSVKERCCNVTVALGIER